MRCSVINVPRHVARLHAFTDGWAAPFGFDVVAAVDGALVGTPARWQHPVGAYGLFATYIGLFVEALRGVLEPFAIFEDDAQLAPDWWSYAEAAIAEAPAGWWTINLGADIEVPGYLAEPQIVSKHLARMPHGWRTHAVVYNPTAVVELLAAMGANQIPVDQVWCDLMLRGSPNFYCTRALLAGARPGVSTITGIAWAEAFVGRFGIGGPHHAALAT